MWDDSVCSRQFVVSSLLNVYSRTSRGRNFRAYCGSWAGLQDARKAAPERTRTWCWLRTGRRRVGCCRAVATALTSVLPAVSCLHWKLAPSGVARPPKEKLVLLGMVVLVPFFSGAGFGDGGADLGTGTWEARHATAMIGAGGKDSGRGVPRALLGHATFSLGGVPRWLPSALSEGTSLARLRNQWSEIVEEGAGLP